MRYKKIWSRELDHCYAVTVMPAPSHDDVSKFESHAFFAAENKNPCFAIPTASLATVNSVQKVTTVWEQPGGTMSIAPIPGKPGEFLAVQKFYRLFDWEEACLVWCKPVSNNGAVTYEVRELFTMPYLHRFDILTRDGKSWLIACTLAAHKATRDDWSQPGSIYVCPLPSDWDGEFKLEVLKGDCFRNHGYARVTKAGSLVQDRVSGLPVDDNIYTAGLVGCEQGVFEIEPPAGDGKWRITQITDRPTSDMDVIDIDGDGELEIATIEPFHGSYFRIYHRDPETGYFVQVFEHPEVSEFYHVVKAGVLCGKSCFVGGCRRGKKQLFAIYWDAARKDFDLDIIEEGVGPSNAWIYNGDPAKGEGDIIFSANREAAHAAAYLVTGD